MLTVHQSNRLEILAGRLAAILGDSPGAPLTPEIVVVQNAGMKRWLSMRIARQLGICAGVAFPLPAELVWQAFRALLDGVPESSPLEPEVATWALMGSLARLEADERFAPVRAYLTSAGAAADDTRRYELARRVADTFAQYLFFRHDWIRAWERGELATGEPGAAPGAAPDEAWQAELWRRLVAARGGAAHFARLEEELRRRLGQLAPGEQAGSGDAARGADLPRRVSLFGLPALPPAILDVFLALGRHLDIHLFLLNPSRAYWFDARSHRDQEREARRVRQLDPSLLHREVGNSLLASLGRQSRDFIASVLAFDDEHVRHVERFEDPLEAGAGAAGSQLAGARSSAAQPPLLLHQIQADILDLRERGAVAAGAKPDPDRFPAIASISLDDRSVQVHACHGPMREVEVLHDQLLALFEANPDLGPCDIVVMTPDIDTYAPCIEAVFATAHPNRYIPFSIADRSIAAESPIVAAFLSLLELPGSRYDANRILDLLELPAVQRRFGLDAEQVELVQRWVRETGIRWAIDGASKASLGLPPTPEHTWRFGLDRLLLGYAFPGCGETLFAGILPDDEVEGAEALALGRLALFTEELFSLDTALATPRSVAAWTADLAALLDLIFLADDEEEVSVQAMRGALGETRQAAESAGFADPVSLEVVRLDLRRKLESPAREGRFLAGRVTFCAMVPMRSVPFEVVCAIGMSDGAFPRSHRPDGFDLIACQVRHGDRSRRDDDRYLFLEALLSARRCFYLSHVGRSIRDNSEIPPSVLVSELLETIRRGFALAGDERGPAAEREAHITEHLITEHPIQAFSRRYFGGDAKLFSYSAELCAAAAAATTPTAPTVLVRGALPPAAGDSSTVDIEHLVRFFAHPVRWFVQSRLGIRLEDGEGLVEPSEPFVLGAEASYSVKSELLPLLLEGRPAHLLLSLTRARGSLPHGSPGEAAFEKLRSETEEYGARLGKLLAGATAAPVKLDGLAVGGLELVGTIGGLTPAGRVDGRPATVKDRDLLALWIRHLALCALGRRGALPPGIPAVSSYVGTDATIHLDPFEAAEEHLAVIAAAYREGRCRPLRLLPRSAFAYARTKAKGGRDPLAAARGVWEGDDFRPGESEDPYFRLVFRDADPLDHDFEALARNIVAPIVGRARKATGRR